jgi:hypothetical protein
VIQVEVDYSRYSKRPRFKRLEITHLMQQKINCIKHRKISILFNLRMIGHFDSQNRGLVGKEQNKIQSKDPIVVDANKAMAQTHQPMAFI